MKTIKWMIRLFVAMAMISFVSSKLFAAAPPAATKDQVKDAVTILVDKKILSSDDAAYFERNAFGNKANVDGERVGKMIIAAAKRYDPSISDVATAADRLKTEKVIGNSDGWKKTAQPGQMCIGKYVGYLLQGLSTKVK